MKDQTHIVLDLETMGKGPRAAITAIGAARVVGCEVVDTFYRKVDLSSSMRNGGELTASTIEWWLGQSEDARAAMVQPGEDIALCLLDFSDWLGRKEFSMWGNGSNFDNVILESAYHAFHAVNTPDPWPYNANRDLRTILALYPEAKNIEFTGEKHNALHDAVHQAKMLIAALEMHGA